MKEGKWHSIVPMGLVLVLACSLVLTTSCVSKEYSVTETYYETEMRQESYVVTERYVTEQLVQKSEVLFEGDCYVVEAVLFTINRSDATLLGTFEGPPGAFRIFTSHHPPAGKMKYESLGGRGTFDISLGPGEYHTAFSPHPGMEGGMYHLRLTLVWTELEEATEQKQATKYREVPVQVEKQRTVVETRKVPIWELILDR